MLTTNFLEAFTSEMRLLLSSFRCVSCHLWILVICQQFLSRNPIAASTDFTTLTFLQTSPWILFFVLYVEYCMGLELALEVVVGKTMCNSFQGSFYSINSRVECIANIASWGWPEEKRDREKECQQVLSRWWFVSLLKRRYSKNSKREWPGRALEPSF